MQNPSGRVLSVDPYSPVPSARVEVAALSCARCAAGKGCGAGLPGVGEKSRCINAGIADGIEVSEGDEVRIELAPRNVLKAALIVYGLPLGGALLAAGVAYLVGLDDLGAVVSALAGIGVGLGVARHRLRATDCLRQLTPIVVERLPMAR